MRQERGGAGGGEKRLEKSGHCARQEVSDITMTNDDFFSRLN